MACNNMRGYTAQLGGFIFSKLTRFYPAVTSQGSGYFHLTTASEEGDVTAAVYHPNNRSLAVEPVTPGSTILTVLSVQTLATLSLAVAGVGSVRLAVQEKLELGNTATATIALFSGQGAPLPASALKYISLVSFSAASFWNRNKVTKM